MAHTKLYEGYRKPAGCILLCNGLPLLPRTDLLPQARYDWGPASKTKAIALAILADFFSEGYAIQCYEQFFDEFLSDHSEDYFQFTDDDLHLVAQHLYCNDLIDWFENSNALEGAA